LYQSETKNLAHLGKRLQVQFIDRPFNGQSLGKLPLTFKAVNKKTMAPCSLLQSFLRNITFLLGIIDWSLIFFESHRRLNDFVPPTTEVKI